MRIRIGTVVGVGADDTLMMGQVEAINIMGLVVSSTPYEPETLDLINVRVNGVWYSLEDIAIVDEGFVWVREERVS